MPLVYYDGWMKKRRQKALLGPGAASEAEFGKAHSFLHLSPSHTLALFIATGIGLHNFSEGLAIGQSAARNQVSLAVVLVIGFALHNATEGFGICAPLSGEAEPPSWAFLGVMGLIAGGPTFIGTLDRTVLGERGDVGRLPRARGRLDPLRDHRAAERPARRRLEGDGHVGDPVRPHSWASARTSC